MKNITVKLSWGVMLFLALAIALVSSRYLMLNPDLYSPQQRVIYIANSVGLLGHIIGAIVALVVGPFQFLPSLRRRWLGIHRWLGRIYLFGIATGGLFGFYMAWLSYGGPVAHTGFALLALLWLYTGAMAYQTIRNKDVQAHRRWMIRNYALTFAAVTLRLWLPILAIGGVEELSAYRTVAWLCWIPNLLIVEWWIQQNIPSSLGKLQQAATGR